jgi:transposase-like protein
MCSVLSLFEFERLFGSEDACIDYLFSQRWPEGFCCPHCGHRQYSFIRTRRLYQCCHCRYQASVTAGTVFHRSRLALRTLFYAVYLLATHKKGFSALELQRKLGIRNYKTAWLLLHKLRRAMRDREFLALIGTVEVDETYLGGSRHGPRGRGAENKELVAVAVETHGKKMGRSMLEQLPGAKREHLEPFVLEKVQAGSTIITDGFASYNRLKERYFHDRRPQKAPEDSLKLLPKVHIVITNLKAWMRGTFNRYPSPKHLDAYLREFQFRFNRRWKPEHIFDQLLKNCIFYNTVTMAELTG